MNRDLDPTPKPDILEGEILSPGPAGQRGRAGEHAKPHTHVVKIGWFGKTIAILAMLAIFAAAILLAAGALLILLPIAILGALVTWWQMRKMKR